MGGEKRFSPPIRPGQKAIYIIPQELCTKSEAIGFHMLAM